jgi:hypothetical protein
LEVEVIPSADGFLAQRSEGESLTWLNRTAYLVFQLCTGENDTKSIARALQDAFDLYTPPLQAVRDTVGELVAAGLVISGSDTSVDNFFLDINVWAPGPSIDTDTLNTVLALVAEVEDAGIPTRLRLDRDQNFRVARNRAANRLLRDSDATHALFLDALPDAIIAVSGCDMPRLVQSAHDVIAIPVPIGQPLWADAIVAARALPELTSRELDAFARSYDISFTSLPNASHFESGFIEGRHCNTGALLVSRIGLERIAGSNLANRHRGNVSHGEVTMADGWGFFDPGLTADHIDLDEDFAFCERVRGAGLAVMIDLQSDLGISLQVSKRLQGRG